MNATCAFVRALAEYSYQVHVGMNADAYRVRLKHRDRSTSGREFRADMTRVQTKWGEEVYQAMIRNLRIRATFELPERVHEPCIVIANHQSTADMPVLYHVFHELDLNVRWVMKAPLRYVPVIGQMAVDSGCIFVNRARDPKDLERIREGAALALKEGASIHIFPDGTRRQAELGLPPKSRGFMAIREQMPKAPVLLVTIKWDRTPGRTIMDAVSFFRVQLTVRAQFFSAAQVDADPQWLSRTWASLRQTLAV